MLPVLGELYTQCYLSRSGHRDAVLSRTTSTEREVYEIDAQILLFTKSFVRKYSNFEIPKLTSFSKLISSSLIFNFFFGLSSISNNLLLTFKILLISCLRLTGAPSRLPGSTAENIMPRFGEWNVDAAGRGRFIGVSPLSCPKMFF